MSRRLYRSRSDRMLAGVCGGIAAYLDADPTLVRVVYVVATFFTGILGGLALYLVLAVLMPESSSADSDDLASSSFGTLASAGIILIIIGALLLVANYGLIAWWTWSRLWPVILIVAGLILLARRKL